VLICFASFPVFGWNELVQTRLRSEWRLRCDVQSQGFPFSLVLRAASACRRVLVGRECNGMFWRVAAPRVEEPFDDTWCVSVVFVHEQPDGGRCAGAVRTTGDRLSVWL
jgi:hypothetical protein